MRKTFSLIIIMLLYLMPLAVFAQKARGPQAKTGKLEIKVSFIGEFSANINKQSGSSAKTGVFTSRVTANYKYIGTNRATSRNGNISVDGSKGESTKGGFSYEYAGKLTEKTSRGGLTEIDEKGSFSGNITEVGTGSVTMDGGSDSIQEMEVSASADVRGYFVKTMKSDGKTIVDRGCTNATLAIGIPEIPENTPDPSMPPEQACKGKMLHSTNAYKTFSEGYWSPMKTEGSFAAGSYTFKFLGSMFPPVYQKNEGGDVFTYKETLSIEGTWILTSGGAKKPALAMSQYDFGFDTALLTRRFNLLPERT